MCLKIKIHQIQISRLSSKKKVTNVLAIFESCWISMKTIEASTKETKTIKRGKLEPKHNCVSKFPGKVNWCFSNCSLKPMVRCVPYGTLHAIIREMHWKMPGEIVLGFNPPQTHYKLQLSLAKCLLHCLLVIKLILEYQISYSPCYSWF